MNQILNVYRAIKYTYQNTDDQIWTTAINRSKWTTERILVIMNTVRLRYCTMIAYTKKSIMHISVIFSYKVHLEHRKTVAK